MKGLELIANMKGTLDVLARYCLVDKTILAGQIRRESAWDPRALGQDGEIGLAQIKLSTARDLFPNWVESDLYNPYQNVLCQAAYLRWILDTLSNLAEYSSVRWALAAYNWGVGNVMRLQDANKGSGLSARDFFNRFLPVPVVQYVDDIWEFARQIEEEDRWL